MAVRFSREAPPEAKRLIESHLSNGQRNTTSGGAKSFSQDDNLTTSEGIQTWRMDLDGIKSGSIEAAMQGDWRYMVFDSINVISEVQLSGGAGDSSVLSSGFGPATVGIMDAMILAEKELGDTDAEYEPRVLQIPNLTVICLWMHSFEGDDLFIAVPPTSLSIENMQPVGELELMNALQESANSLQEMSESAPGPSGGTGGGLESMSWPPQMENGAVVPKIVSLDDLEFDKPSIVNARSTTTGTGGLSSNYLPQFMEFQSQSNWCWAAVGTSVGNLFNTGSWEQCDTASGCLPGRDCCSIPRTCNIYGYLDKSLTYTKSLQSYNSSMTDLATIRQEIDKGYPICTRVAWDGGGAHFMAITAYDGNDITIQDPAYGTTTMNYSDYATRYQSGGYWSHTYYCQP